MFDDRILDTPIYMVALRTIKTDTMTRDRLDLEGLATSEEMAALKASIRANGVQEPIVLFRDFDRNLHLQSGWRRLTAMAQLWEETEERRFACIPARIFVDDPKTLGPYIAMVQSNMLRKGVSFAELAALACAVRDDPTVETPGDIVNALYGSMPKTKRSYIRAFMTLFEILGPHMRWPQAVSRELGHATQRRLAQSPPLAPLKAALDGCESAEDQNDVLREFAKGVVLAPPTVVEVQGTKAIARVGDLRLTSRRNFAAVPPHQLRAAVKAFLAVLNKPGWVKEI